jgi:RNA polymerase sigma factor (TIGR02999 family)
VPVREFRDYFSEALNGGGIAFSIDGRGGVERAFTRARLLGIGVRRDGRVTQVLARIITAAESGDRSARDALFATLYSELRRIARRELGRHGAPFSLGPSTVLHQAYIEMAGADELSFPDRARFMAYAARVMRGLIIDHARSRRALKRGGQFHLTTLVTETGDGSIDEQELTRISDALEELAGIDGELAEIVDLKYFCGFSHAEIAAMRQVSERTVQRQWEKARIYLHRSLRADPPR